MSYCGIVDLISATTTITALTVHRELNQSHYPESTAVSDEQMASLNITRHAFHGEQNYTINRRNNSDRQLAPDKPLGCHLPDGWPARAIPE